MSGTNIAYQLKPTFHEPAYKHKDNLRYGPCSEPPYKPEEILVADLVHGAGNPSKNGWLEDHMMLDTTPRGKVVLVTGQGSAGLPRESLLNWIAQCGRVYVVDLHDHSEAVANLGPGCSFIQHACGKDAQWEVVAQRIIAEAGRIDIVMNNAGA
jgi:hypothetical protein